MSLQVWLPLNGSLENLGLADKLTTLNGWQTVTGYSDGKIGKAINLLGSYYAFNIPTLVDSKVFSCAFWYMQNSSSSLTANWQKIVSFITKADGTTGNLRFESSYGITGYAVSTHSNTAYQICPIGVGNRPLVAESGVWHHVALTVDGITITYYVDGNLHHSGAQTDGMLTGEVRVGWYNMSADGWLNDLRIYDHALSQKEVKELSKGLVAHYPLNDFVGNSNLIQNGYGNTKGTTWIAEGCTLTVEDDCFKIVSTSTNKRIYDNVSNVWDSGEVYTVSFLARSDTDGAVINASRSIVNFSPNFTLSTEWKQYSGIITSTETAATGTLSIRLVTASTVYLKLVKLEKGSVATPWTPNVQDSLYSAMGLDEGIVYDCSGYGRNCNVTGTMTADSSSPRYYVAAKFDQTVYASGSSTTSEGKTLSLWIKCDPTALANHVAFIDYRSMLAFGFYNSYACITTVNNTTCKQIYNKTLIPSNIWTHIAVVRDMTTPKMCMYINGVEQTPISGSDAWGSGISDGLTIGARTNGNNKFYGSISDIRIYCTALSAEDIKALYETSVTIDDKGNFHAYEISEV